LNIATVLQGASSKGFSCVIPLGSAGSVGEDLHLQVLRDGRLLNIDVHSGLRPSESQVASNEAMSDGDQAPDDRGDGSRVLGMRLGPLSAQARQRYRVSGEQTGVVVEGLGQHSDAQHKGMAPGDVIVKAGADMVRSPNDVATAGAERGKTAATTSFCW
jgi:serine protease Do